MDKLSSHITPPSEGTTAQKNTLTPRTNQKFFDTTLGKEQQWDGTAWGAVVAKLPPRQGIIGLAATTHWRLVAYNMPSGYGCSFGELFSSAGVVPGMASITFNRPLSVFTPAPGYAAAPSVFNNVNSSATLNNRYSVNSKITATGLVTSVAKLVIDFVYPTPFTPDTLSLAYDTTSSTYLRDFAIYTSTDKGVTWSLVDTLTGIPSTGVTKQIPVPTYPANPSDGQRFFNATTNTDTRWDNVLQQWVAVTPPSPIPWKVIAAATQLVAGDAVMLVPTAAFSVTLPPTPAAGDSITIADGSGVIAANNVAVLRNGSTIKGLAQDLVLNINDMRVDLVFTGTDWRVV